MEIKENRKTELDILRLLAVLAVIMTHLCGGPVKTLNLASSLWVGLNCLRAAVTWDVPVFVMISGCLFLRPEKEISLKKLYGKYIAHLVICFLVWSAAFQSFYFLTGASSLNWKGIMLEYLMGPYPFWYLFMQIGLYMMVPFLRRIAENKRLTEYFILLAFVFSALNYYGTILPGIGNTVSEILAKSQIYFVLGFTGYYLLGYYLMNHQPSKGTEILLYVLGAVSLIFSCVGTTWQSRQQGAYNEYFSKYLTPNVMLEAAALFTFFVKRVSKIQFSPRATKVLGSLSQLGLGVYLIHALVIEVLNALHITVLSGSPFLMVPALVLVVYAVSLGLTWVIRKIPYVGKKIT